MSLETSPPARLISVFHQLLSPRFALELGCGDCPGLPAATPGAAHLFISVDHDPAALMRASRHGMFLVQADVARLPFRCRFDLILIRHPDLDHHFLHWKPAIQQTISFLADAGTLLITTYSLSECETARHWLAEIGLTPVPYNDRRLVPAGLDGRDRFVIVYRTPSSSADRRLSTAVSPSHGS